MWYLVIVERTILGVYGAALQQEALNHRDEIANGAQQIAHVVRSRKRFFVGERLPHNARVLYE